MGEQILNGVATIQKAKSEEDKKEYEDIALSYIQDLDKLISKQVQKPIDDLIVELNSAPKKSKKK